MKTSDFNFDLPEELIAQEPPEERGTSRMMVLHRATGTIEHRRISDIGDYLDSDDLLVLNNTKVFSARILGQKAETGGNVELLLVEELQQPGSEEHSKIANCKSQISTWDCFLKSGRRPKPGSELVMADGLIRAVVLELREQGRVIVSLESSGDLFAILEEKGFAPVPPYIRRGRESNEQTDMDKSRYQTVYASETGAVAAPTAGLHFTDEILSDLSDSGVKHAEVTLHVGPGTFKPVDAENVEDHQMESERYVVSQATADAINSTRSKGGRIVAVGSTSVRTLESVADEDGHMAASAGRSSIFIYPPYNFRVVDAMLTNFHLPMSSLIMMISALAGRDKVLSAYREAVKEGYRFYSYGDCMLIL